MTKLSKFAKGNFHKSGLPPELTIHDTLQQLNSFTEWNSCSWNVLFTNEIVLFTNEIVLLRRKM